MVNDTIIQVHLLTAAEVEAVKTTKHFLELAVVRTEINAILYRNLFLTGRLAHQFK